MNEILDVFHREFVYIWYHFDVQLRQIFWYWVFGIILGSCVSVFLKDRIHGVLKKMSAAGSVSYTHLDVYKRQLLAFSTAISE